MNLSILCVSKQEEYAEPFIQAMIALAGRLGVQILVWDGREAGCIEKVLDEALIECPPGYILRLDDDEAVTPEMEKWLNDGHYELFSHWAFPRYNLYQDEKHYISTLYPDLQTRLSLRQIAGGRTMVHQGSPFGTGQIAPVHLEHHKFLCRSYEERRALVEEYDRIAPGAGTDFADFSIPEDFPDLEIAER